MELWTALSIGLLGSLHCVGMCGPIALALPLNRSNAFTVFAGSMTYQLGRLSTYVLLGVIFGTLGRGISLAGFQQGLSISVGVIMIVSVLWPIFKLKPLKVSGYDFWLGQLKGRIGKQFGRTSNQSLFIIGLLNGLLPCGLVYMGIAGASAMASPAMGGLFMLFFGLGTLPLLLAVSVYGGQLQKKVIHPFRKYIPVLVLLIGSLFILRGMNLGIPYVSPILNAQTPIIKCY